MPTCVLCLETLKNPAALPCGHVFCYECIVRLVRTVQPYVYQHYCPTCRYPYSISTVNPALVPSHLRQHVTPSIRRLSLDYTLPFSTKSGPASEEPLANECARLRAENASLKNCCTVWSRRARWHAGASLSLIGLVRLARENAERTKVEKEKLERRCEGLKRKIEEVGKINSYKGIHHPRPCPLPRTQIFSPSPFCPSPSHSSLSADTTPCEECQREREERPRKRRHSEPPPEVSGL